MKTVTRRSLLAVAIATAAAGAGAAGGLIGWTTAPNKARIPPAAARTAPVLEAEYDREMALLGRLNATIAAGGPLAATAQVLLTDHEQHVDALVALLADAGVHRAGRAAAGINTSASTPSAGGTGSALPAPPTPFADKAELVSTETAAGQAAAAASLQVAGSAAATLASLSAGEATHVAWLS